MVETCVEKDARTAMLVSAKVDASHCKPTDCQSLDQTRGVLNKSKK